jgi:hypothetical protein
MEGENKMKGCQGCRGRRGDGEGVREHPFSPPSYSDPPPSTLLIPSHLPMSSLNGIRPHILSCWLCLDSVPCFRFIFLHQVTFISFLLSILILFLYLFSIVYKVSYFISHIVTVAPPSRSHPFLLESSAKCVSCSLNVSINLSRVPC